MVNKRLLFKNYKKRKHTQAQGWVDWLKLFFSNLCYLGYQMSYHKLLISKLDNLSNHETVT